MRSVVDWRPGHAVAHPMAIGSIASATLAQMLPAVHSSSGSRTAPSGTSGYTPPSTRLSRASSCRSTAARCPESGQPPQSWVSEKENGSASRHGLLGVSVVALVVSAVSVGFAVCAVIYARRSANASVESADAATRSADLAEVVERGRHHGWRIEARAHSQRSFTLRNVGTVDARNVTLAGSYYKIQFHRVDDDDDGPTHIAAGQARLFSALQAHSKRGGAIDITWTPDLPDAEPMTWTEVPPVVPLVAPREGEYRCSPARSQPGGVRTHAVAALNYTTRLRSSGRKDGQKRQNH